MRLFLLFVFGLCQLASYLLFCRGFFPTKVLLTPDEIEQFKTDPPKGYVKPAAQFDRVVVMVIDALRSDFMFSNNSYMTNVHDLLNSNYGFGFTAYSNPPTVTLPRLKGLTTGSTPNFIDAVLNIAEDDTSSTLGDQDSWIKQMFLSDWKINMFGDDTWLKLFPDYFAKTDGTASFYVSDFTHVDNNVTRHLDYELSAQGQKEWDCMILHYLGLDHIGHKGGPLSSNMPGKQQEMDKIIKRVFDSLKQDENTLFVVLGDHGMNEVGNHGGSSAGETSAALSIFSPKFKSLGIETNNGVNAPIAWNPDYEFFSKIDQIDLIPTLSSMLGLSVPINNLGAFIEKLLPLYSEKEQINILIENALQLKVLLDKSKGEVNKLEDLVDVSNKDDLLSFIKNTKETLSKTSSDYNYTDIHYGIGAYAIISLIFIGLYIYSYVSKKIILLGAAQLTWFTFYGISFFGSSLIEEEHHFWWLFTTIYLAVIFYQFLCNKPIANYKPLGKIQNFFAPLILAGALRLLKAWNNSGQKYNLKSNIKISTYLMDHLPAKIFSEVISMLVVSTLNIVGVFMIDNFQTESLGKLIKFLGFVVLAFTAASAKFMSFVVESFDLEDPDLVLPRWTTDLIDWHVSKLDVETAQEAVPFVYGLFQTAFIVIFLFFLLRPLLFKILPFLSEILAENEKDSDGKYKYFSNLQCIISILLITQTSTANIPIFALLFLIQDSFTKIFVVSIRDTNYSTFDKITTTLSGFILLLQNLSFFQFGSTNALSSVDLTNSFNGVTSYNMILVGFLTFISNWASPIFWSLSYLRICFDVFELQKLRLRSRKTSQYISKTIFSKWDILYSRMVFQFAFYSIGGLLLILSCYNLRFHLFIWTVFDPKLLYFLSWYVMHLVADFGFSSLLIALYL